MYINSLLKLTYYYSIKYKNKNKNHTVFFIWKNREVTGYKFTEKYVKYPEYGKIGVVWILTLVWS